jgi:NAD(P)-dependent dehydrogenase (short-subunit alcohol dehydrogenase family)
VPNTSSRRAVLVTGASRGLGLETALMLAAEGFAVWAGSRNPDVAQMQSMAAKRNVRLNIISLDVTSDESVRAAFRQIERGGVPLFGIVNNAGITGRCWFEDYPEENIRGIFDVNVFGTMRVTRLGLPLLREAGGGRIIMQSSIGGRIGSIGIAPYSASKFALEGFGESLSLELRPLNIFVSIVEPGIVKTSIWDEKRILQQAHNRESAYHDLFWRAEALAERVLNSSRLRSSDVASTVLRAMTERNPRLRYVVGRRAGLVLSLRRHLPGELFERLYFGGLLRRVNARHQLETLK